MGSENRDVLPDSPARIVPLSERLNRPGDPFDQRVQMPILRQILLVFRITEKTDLDETRWLDLHNT